MNEYIRKMELKDVDEVTDISINNIKALQSELGKEINKLFYRGLLKKNFGFVYVIKEDNEKIAGFITGTINKKDIINFKLIFLIFIKVINKPLLFFDLLGMLFSKDESFPELFSVAIRPDCQRKGIGKKLTFALIEEFKRRNIKKIHTKVVSSSSANIFYQKLGFKLLKKLNRHPKVNILELELK